MIRRLRAIVVGVLALFITLPFWISLFIYRPTALERTDPAEWRLPQARAVAIASGGETLSAWWAPPAAPGEMVMLIVHGRSANMATRAFVAERLIAEGYGVLMFDYRGYGASTGSPSEAALTADSRAALTWLRRQGVGPERVVVIGQSIGNAPAAQVASGAPVAAVVFVSPFTSLPEAAADRVPWLPVGWLPWLRNRFDVGSSVTSLDIPVVLVASHTDGLVPMSNSRRLGSLARNALWLVDDRFTHEGLLTGVLASGDLQRILARWRRSPRPDPQAGKCPPGVAREDASR